MQRVIAGAALALALALGACESPPEPASFPVTFTANAGDPLAGVDISIEGGKHLGQTGANGTLHVTLTGREGTAVPFRVQCPDGYRAPAQMPVLRLRRFTGLDPATAARGIEVSIDCPPAERMAALVVRAGHADLPVLAQGREVARTNAAGVAHALLELPPASTFRVVVDTTAAPDLRPQNPETTLTLHDADEIFVIDPGFQVAKVEPPPEPRRRPKRRARKRRKKKPEGPRLPIKLE